MSERRIRLDPGLMAAVAGMMLLVFIIGVAFGVLKIFPYRVVDEAHQAMVALGVAQRIEQGGRLGSNMWHPLRPEFKGRSGVTVNLVGAVSPGLTLYSSGHDQAVRLIDAAGREVHRWHTPWDLIWEADWDHNVPPPKDRIYVRDARLFPNGDILMLYVGFGPSPWGLALVKADRNSNIIWKIPRKIHHDLDTAPDGRIYTLTHRIREDIPAGLKLPPGRVFDDAILVLDPDGRPVREVSILEAFAASPYADLLASHVVPDNGDILHTNSIVFITAEIAARFPFARPGQVLVCLRNMDTLAVVDLEEKAVVWVQAGPWNRPHDPDLLPNGNLMIFDNDWQSGRRSRVVEYDPLTLKTVRQYSGHDANPLYSYIRSRQQVLANGNLLICESDGGRLVEIDPRGQTVWEFVNPVREISEGLEYIPVVSTGLRYPPEKLSFLR